MRLHSDTLTISDLLDALVETGLAAKGIILDESSPRGSRSRRQAFEVQLAATREYNGKDKRRRRNSGIYGAAGGEVWAATYAEHGEWMAHLYDKDENMRIAFYTDRADFHEKTHGEFRAEVTEGMP